MAEVFVGEPALLRTEEQGDAGRGKVFADEGRTLFKAPDRVLQFAEAGSSGSNDEGAVRDGFGHGFELLCADEHRRGSDGGTRFAKRQFIGIHDTKMEETEVAHGAGGRADVERVARIDEDDAQAVELGSGGQGETTLQHTPKDEGEENAGEGVRRLARAARGNIDCGR